MITAKYWNELREYENAKKSHVGSQVLSWKNYKEH